MYNDKWFKCPNSQGCQDPVERRSTSPNFVTNIYGFIIERNSQIFDTPTLICQGGLSGIPPVMKNLTNVNIPLWFYWMVPKLT